MLLAADGLLAPPLAAPGDASPLAEISGRVYRMELAGTGELGGIAAVELTLLDEVGRVVDVTHTAADGGYRFAGLPAGLYAVQQRQPAGFVDGPDSIGLAGGQVLTDDLLGEIALAAGQAATGYNFAEYAPSDAPGATLDGLPQLILAGGGVAGPGVAVQHSSALRMWTPPAPPVVELSAVDSDANRAPASSEALVARQQLAAADESLQTTQPAAAADEASDVLQWDGLSPLDEGADQRALDPVADKPEPADSIASDQATPARSRPRRRLAPQEADAAIAEGEPPTARTEGATAPPPEAPVIRQAVQPDRNEHAA